MLYGEILFAAILSLPCPAESTRPPMTATQIDQVLLEDVQGMEGGREISLQNQGDVLVRIVNPSPPKEGLQEKRYAWKLTKVAVSEFEALLQTHDFFHFETQKRPGTPDEAKIKLTVRMKSGLARTVEKWERDKHPGFDAVYRWLLEMENQVVKNGKLIDQGAYSKKTEKTP